MCVSFQVPSYEDIISILKNIATAWKELSA